MKWSLTEMGVFESDAPNRTGKSFNQAVGGWFAFNEGKTVYCNCPTNPVTNKIEHILNYPHVDYDPYELINSDLYGAYIITDQAEQVMDARVCQKKDIRNLGYFSYQAKKRGLSWHYDTVRHKNIDPRIRLNPDYILYLYRIPKNWREPLQTIRIRLTWDGGEAWLRFPNPQQFFGDPKRGIPPIYNDKVMLRPLK